MKLENAVYQDFKKAVTPLMMHIHRIENAIQFGTFDLTLSRTNRTLWVELKRDAMESLRPSQIRWALDRYQAGCTSDMVVVCPHKNGDWCTFDVNHVIMNQGKLFSVTSATDSELRIFLLRKMFAHE